jgi:casein kinase I homolog HRR25
VVESIHSHGFIHRDIKPEHFLLDATTGSHFKIVDFGLASQYRDNNTYCHIPCKQERNRLPGTPQYWSINAHSSITLSRRDDLESLAYITIYLLHGSLPWQHIKAKYACKTKKMAALDKKSHLNLPSAFSSFLNYAHALEFSELPDYHYIRQLFQDCFTQEGYQDDGIYDWNAITATRDYHNDSNQEVATSEGVDRTGTSKAVKSVRHSRRYEYLCSHNELSKWTTLEITIYALAYTHSWVLPYLLLVIVIRTCCLGFESFDTLV